jgi:hypothetical protein
MLLSSLFRDFRHFLAGLIAGTRPGTGLTDDAGPGTDPDGG